VDRLICNDLGPCSVTDLEVAYADVMPDTPSADRADVSGAGSAGGGPLAQAIRIALKLAATA
jgi:hypothetical protein